MILIDLIDRTRSTTDILAFSEDEDLVAALDLAVTSHLRPGCDLQFRTDELGWRMLRHSMEVNAMRTRNVLYVNPDGEPPKKFRGVPIEVVPA